ncbi:c-type cytochrome [Ideonella sp. YS5]|uniref:c-type cytochrome n=1 Tax=Ideonella sp. YS5 TaxID=3453714 RepID=UPI003EED3E22
MAAAPRGDATLGAQKADSERCQECHGVDGQGGSAESRFARLAGQHPEYLAKQLRDFRSGARRQDFMALMARSISDEDVADIAAYFAGLPAMRSPLGAAPQSAPVAELFERGDATRGITACASCHGPQGRGLHPADPRFPRLAGQDSRYLARQLADWRSGERRNDPSGGMNRTAVALRDDEIEALADYMASR